MTFRSIEEFEQVLRDTPAAARYLDLYWAVATTYDDWWAIRIRMASAEQAIRQFNPDDAEVYALLRDVAAIHANSAAATVVQPFMVATA